MQAWNKGCKGCIYLGKLCTVGQGNQYCCDYFLITGERRGCSPVNCEKKMTGKHMGKTEIEQRIRYLAVDHNDNWLSMKFDKPITEIREIVGDMPRLFHPKKLLPYNVKRRISWQEVIEEKAKGKNHNQIAEEFGCSRSTVDRMSKEAREGGTSR